MRATARAVGEGEAARARVRRALPTIALEQVRIASPCTASWEAMTGDARTRHCGQCDRAVHDLSAMTRAEAEALLAEAAGRGERTCVRLWVRRDGRVLTQDCPVGLAAVRRRLRRVATAAGALAWGLLGLLGITGCTGEADAGAGAGAGAPAAAPAGGPVGPVVPAAPVDSRVRMGEIAAAPGGLETEVLMGKVAAPDPEVEVRMGDVAAPTSR